MPRSPVILFDGLWEIANGQFNDPIKLIRLHHETLMVALDGPIDPCTMAAAHEQYRFMSPLVNRRDLDDPAIRPLCDPKREPPDTTGIDRAELRGLLDFLRRRRPSGLGAVDIYGDHLSDKVLARRDGGTKTAYIRSLIPVCNAFFYGPWQGAITKPRQPFGMR